MLIVIEKYWKHRIETVFSGDTDTSGERHLFKYIRQILSVRLWLIKFKRAR